jgi:hypothetical protein
LIHRPYLAAAAASGLLALVHPAIANAADFAGAWHGAVSNLAVNIVIAPDQQFTETFVTGAMTTNVKGHIVPFAPGVVTFVVDDWSPKSNPVDKAVTYGVNWVNPNEVVLTDVNKHGSITLVRVP